MSGHLLRSVAHPGRYMTYWVDLLRNKKGKKDLVKENIAECRKKLKKIQLEKQRFLRRLAEIEEQEAEIRKMISDWEEIDGMIPPGQQ